MSQATGYIPRDYKAFPLGCDKLHTKEWDIRKMPLLSRKEAIQKAKDNIADGLDPLSMMIKRNVMPTYQNGLGYCWIHAAVMAMMEAMARMGLPVLRLCPTGPGALIKNYRDRGGNAFEAFPHLRAHGCPTTDYWKPNSLSKSNDTPEMREDAKRRLVLEWFELPDNSDEYKWTAMANCYSVWCGYANMGHAMCGARLEEDSRGNPVSVDINSWNKDVLTATTWDERWLGDSNTVYRRSGRNFRCFEQYAVRLVSIAV